MSLRYSVAMATEPKIVLVDNVRAAQGGSATTLADGEWFWVSNVLYYRSDAGNPDTLGLSVEAGQRAYCIFTNSKNYLTFDSLTLKRANAFLDGGTAGCIYVSSTPSGMTFANVTITEGAGPGICTNGAITGLTLTACSITACGNAGIAALTDSGHTNINITLSDVSYNGWRTGATLGFCSGVKMGIESGEVSYSTFTENGHGRDGDAGTEHGCYFSNNSATSTLVAHHNTCTGNQGNGLKSNGSWTAHHNRLIDNDVSGIAPIRLAVNTVHLLHHNIYSGNVFAGIYEDGSGAGTISLTIENETIYNVGNTTGAAIYIQDDLTALTIKNCIVWAGATRFAFQGPTQTGTVAIDYNLYWRADATPPFYVSTTITWAQWQALGYDANGLIADPLFVNAGTDFHLQAGSPAINAGVNVGLTTDYDGSVVPQGPAPDIGAYEYPLNRRYMNQYRQRKAT